VTAGCGLANYAQKFAEDTVVLTNRNEVFT
jgi:hypothetical protein